MDIDNSLQLYSPAGNIRYRLLPYVPRYIDRDACVCVRESMNEWRMDGWTFPELSERQLQIHPFILKYLWRQVRQSPFLHKHTTTITPRELGVIARLSDLGGVVVSPPCICFSWLVCLCAEISQGA